ncbi:MAG: hypothetical protein KU37_07645 [Sulfuricurvum sp. PC08-66]|nr:MAG: hypothetical protein KU37_07645 [Sulfuricurvum sp. PC08-66]
MKSLSLINSLFFSVACAGIVARLEAKKSEKSLKKNYEGFKRFTPLLSDSPIDSFLFLLFTKVSYVFAQNPR